MNWFLNTLWSSIGKKMMMAVTGLCFSGFLISHLAGNLFIYGGRDAFNSYAERLHSLGPLLTVAEIALLFMALVHVITGATLFYENFNARPNRYAVNKSAGGRSLGSATMPYTGFFMLFFIIFHLVNFHFVDKTHQTIFDIVSGFFSNPVYMVFYIFSMVIVGIHVSHGLWSAFQTLGANHPRYMPIIMTASLVFSLIVGIGFGFLPVYISLIA